MFRPSLFVTLLLANLILCVIQSISPEKETRSSSSCTFGWCGKDPYPDPNSSQKPEIEPYCLRSLAFDADIQNFYRGEHWMSTGWKNNLTTWNPPVLCPDFSLVTGYGFLANHQFFMNCDPAENIIEPGATNRTTVTIKIPTGGAQQYVRRYRWEAISVESTTKRRRSLHHIDARIPNETIKVSPFITGFEPDLFIFNEDDDFEISLLSFYLTGPNTRHNYYKYKTWMEHSNGWESCPWGNSSWSLRECPSDHTICGVTTTLKPALLADMATFAFKCCPVCHPREAWTHIHTVINRSSRRYFHFYQWMYDDNRPYEFDSGYNFEKYDSNVESSYMARFAPIFGPRAAHGFTWNWRGPDSNNDMGQVNDTDYSDTMTGTDTEEGSLSCPPWSTCRYKQLLGLCKDDVVVKTGHFAMNASPLTFRDLFHCLVLDSEPFFQRMNTCVTQSLSSVLG